MQKLIKTSARRFASLVPKATGSEAALPAYNEKLAETHPKLMPYSSDYSNVTLHKYFKENALIIPPEKIIEKANQRDYEYFLAFPNFLKVVDTLEKFSSQLNVENEEQRRNFIDFKQKLYDYYAIQHRSIAEHEKYSFTIERSEISALAKANQQFVQRLLSERNKEVALNKQMLKGKIFAAKALNKERIQGTFAGLSAYAIYHYLPYFTLYLGHNIPILAAVFAGLYTIGAFGETNYVKEISFVGPQSDLVAIKYCVTPFVEKTIHAKPQNIRSGISRASHDGLMIVKEAIDAATNEPIVEKELSLAIPKEAWKDQQALDWVISTKSASFDTDKALLNQILESSNAPTIENVNRNPFPEIADVFGTSTPITNDKIQQLVAKYGDEHWIYIEKLLNRV